jgi:hypothetical protein
MQCDATRIPSARSRKQRAEDPTSNPAGPVAVRPSQAVRGGLVGFDLVGSTLEVSSLLRLVRRRSANPISLFSACFLLGLNRITEAGLLACSTGSSMQDIVAVELPFGSFEPPLPHKLHRPYPTSTTVGIRLRWQDLMATLRDNNAGSHRILACLCCT